MLIRKWLRSSVPTDPAGRQRAKIRHVYRKTENGVLYKWRGQAIPKRSIQSQLVPFINFRISSLLKHPVPRSSRWTYFTILDHHIHVTLFPFICTSYRAQLDRGRIPAKKVSGDKDVTVETAGRSSEAETSGFARVHKTSVWLIKVYGRETRKTLGRSKECIAVSGSRCERNQDERSPGTSEEGNTSSARG